MREFSERGNFLSSELHANISISFCSPGNYAYLRVASANLLERNVKVESGVRQVPSNARSFGVTTFSDYSPVLDEKLRFSIRQMLIAKYPRCLPRTRILRRKNYFARVKKIIIQNCLVTRLFSNFAIKTGVRSRRIEIFFPADINIYATTSNFAESRVASYRAGVS